MGRRFFTKQKKKRRSPHDRTARSTHTPSVPLQDPDERMVTRPKRRALDVPLTDADRTGPAHPTPSSPSIPEPGGLYPVGPGGVGPAGVDQGRVDPGGVGPRGVDPGGVGLGGVSRGE